MQERSFQEVFSSKRMTPQELIKLAAVGRSSKTAIASVLRTEKRMEFLKRCNEIELSYTCKCGSSGNTCLEGGCSMSAGEVCLEAVLNAEPDYSLRVYWAWLELFKNPENRTDEWKK